MSYQNSKRFCHRGPKMLIVFTGHNIFMIVSRPQSNIHIKCKATRLVHSRSVKYIAGNGQVFRCWNRLSWDNHFCNSMNFRLAQLLVQAQIKENTNLRVTCLCVGNPPVTGEFLAQRASSTDNVSLWWRHYDMWTPSFLSSSRYPWCSIRDMEMNILSRRTGYALTTLK